MTREILENLILIIFTSFTVSLIGVPFIKKIASHIGAIDIPNSRKIHKNPIPRLGGLSIFISFLLGYMLFAEESILMNSILIGSFIIILTGIIDDIKPMRSSTKFIGQLLAALVVVFYGNILLKDISAFGFYINFGIFTYPLTIFFILGCINCMNFIDGLDGLAGGISSIYFLTVGIIAVTKGQFGLDYTLAFIMFGATLGFLIFNFHPASIFMGDTGSMFLGFIISIIALLGFKNITMSSLIIPLSILAIPILDIIFAIIRRMLKGQKISTPDCFHIHHQLLNKNISQSVVVMTIYIINILFAAASIIYVLVDAFTGYIIYGALLFLIIIFVLKTDVIFEHKCDGKKE